MSTPYTALSGMVRNAVAIFWVLWLGTFAITRTYALHEAYMSEVGRRNDEQWLLLQCASPEFYANMRQHSHLCTEVSSGCHRFAPLVEMNFSISFTPGTIHAWSVLPSPVLFVCRSFINVSETFCGQVSTNARQNLLLRALSKVAEEKGFYMCGRGEHSCMSQLYSALVLLGWRASFLAALFLLVVPNFLAHRLYRETPASYHASDNGLDITHGGGSLLATLFRGNRVKKQNKSELSSSWLQGDKLVFCNGPYGNAEEVSLLCKPGKERRTSRHGSYGDSSNSNYSPAMRMRKNAFFKDPIAMAQSHGATHGPCILMMENGTLS